MKTILNAAMQADLREALHVAVVAALMQSRRWAAGDLAFQGGTSLHLVYQSPRFSEDLDFLIKDSIDLAAVQTAIAQRLKSAPWVPPGLELAVSKGKDKNPHSFKVSLSGPDVLGGVSVKVELWKTPAAALDALHIVVGTVSPNVANAGLQTLTGMRASVPTIALRELFADKVFALAARRYLKPRDVFDLYWLRQRTDTDSITIAAGDMQTRLLIYPNESAARWLTKATARMQELQDATEKVRTDIARWLPAGSPLDADALVHSAVAALGQGIVLMRMLAATPAVPPV